MENRKIVINTKLSMVDFLQVVNDIVLEFFSIDGTYQPQIGFLNTMRIFYNACVTESKFEKYDIFDALDMEDIVADEEFIDAFNLALKPTHGQRLDFANAYKQAMDIVSNKKTSLNNLIEIIHNMLNTFVNSISEELGEDNIKKIMDIAEKVDTGEITPATIVEAYRQATTSA